MPKQTFRKRARSHNERMGLGYHRYEALWNHLSGPGQYNRYGEAHGSLRRRRALAVISRNGRLGLSRPDRLGRVDLDALRPRGPISYEAFAEPGTV